MEILTQTIQVNISKAQMNTLLSEALADPDSAIAIKRVINPMLANAFPQFADFTNVTLGDTNEDGSVTVSLRQPAQTKAKAPSALKSMEPLVVEPELEEVEVVEETTDDSEDQVDMPEDDASPDYID